MTPWKDRGALLPGWRPERLLWHGELRSPGELGRDLLAEHGYGEPGSDGPAFLWVDGHRGVGSSTVARCVLEAVSNREVGRSGRRARGIRVDVRGCQSGHEILTRLFRHFDEGFDGRGFSGARLASALRRRLAQDPGLSYLWFDNTPSPLDGKDPLSELLPWLPPGPTGDAGLPAPLLAFSGERSPELPSETELAAPSLRVHLPPLSAEEIETILGEMARSAFATPLSPGVALRVRDRLLARGWGLPVGASLLRAAGDAAEQRGDRTITVRDLPSRFEGPRLRRATALDVLFLEGLRAQPSASSTGVRHLQEYVAAHLREEGMALPTASQVRRHLRRLERAGLVQRSVRLGGMGGSQSLVRLGPAFSETILTGSGGGPDPAMTVGEVSGRSPRAHAVSAGPGFLARALSSPMHAPHRAPTPA